MSDELHIDLRDLEIDADMPALRRVWREIGWSDSKQTDRAMLDFYAEGETGVALINGEVECAVLASTAQCVWIITICPCVLFRL